jgi:hypothetical protein
MRSSITPINLTFLEMLQKDEMENTCYANKNDEKFTQYVT